MNRIKNILITMLLIFTLSVPMIVSADSGLDAKYNDSSSGESIFGALSSGFSFTGKLVAAKPGDKDYKSYQVISGIICIVMFYIFTSRYIFKLDKNKYKNKSKVFTLLGISLVPTILFSLFYFLTDTYIILYVFLLLIYLLVFKITTKVILSKRFKNNLNKVKECDIKFNIDSFNEEVFNVYKDVQIAWMNFNYKKLKELISEKLYDSYIKKLEDLDKNNQKNIMDNITFKSNKITNIYVDDNSIIFDCKMNVTCNDYIIDKDEKIVKGKKDKTCDYTYNLSFKKDLKTNKYILVEKKIKKQK